MRARRGVEQVMCSRLGCACEPVPSHTLDAATAALFAVLLARAHSHSNQVASSLYAANPNITGDGDDSILVFGEGDPDMAQLLLRRREQQQQQQQRQPAVAAATTSDGDAAMSEAPAPEGQTAVQAGAEGVEAEEEASGLLTQPGGQWGCWARVAKAHGADVNCVRWNPAEPRLLASCSDDGLIRLWWLR